MLVKTLIEYLNEYTSTNKRSIGASVKVAVTRPFSTMGGTPVVDVTNVSFGFDWDDGKLIVTPSEKLVRCLDVSIETVEDLTNRLVKLKSENAELKRKIKLLKLGN